MEPIDIAKNTISVYKVNFEDNEYFEVISYDPLTRKPQKFTFDKDMQSASIQICEKLNNPDVEKIKMEPEEKNAFVKELDSLMKKQKKDFDKEQKKIEKKYDRHSKDSFMEEFYALKTPEERNEYLAGKGIREGQVFEIKAESSSRDGEEKDVSTVYLEVFKNKDGNLALKTVKDSKLKNDYHEDQIANAEKLAGVSALALISDQFAKNRLNAAFQETGLNDSDWSDYEITFSRKDITKQAIKMREEEKKEKLNKLREIRKNTKNEISDNSPLFSKVPEQVKKIYEDKGRPIDEKIYTAKCFEMFKNIVAVPKEDRAISPDDQNCFSDLIGKMEKFTDDPEKQKKIFDQWVFDNERSNNDRLINLGLLFEKTHNEHFKGYEIKRSEHEKEQREKNLEALKDNLLPFMQNKESVDYIHSADDNKIYEGESQLALQRNNLTNGYNTDCYADLPALISQNVLGHQPMKVSCEIVDLGKDVYGHNHYQLLVPVKPSFAERRKARAEEKKAAKMEKDLRNEEYRRNVADALFKKKYGNLPQYETAVQPVPVRQPPLMKASEIQHSTEKPGKNSTIAEKVQYDIEQYFKCMFTKEPYVPQTDWTTKEAKAELEDFIKNHPEKYAKIVNNAYSSVQSQVRAKARSEENVNQNIAVAENENRKTNGRKI